MHLDQKRRGVILFDAGHAFLSKRDLHHQTSIGYGMRKRRSR